MIAFVGAKLNSEKEVMVINGKEGPEYDGVQHPFFSSDGKYVGYGALQGAPHNTPDTTQGELWWKVESLKDITTNQ